MKYTATALALLASTMLGSARADEGPVPHGVPALEHVFVIMMENHGYGQIIGNPAAPFINAEAQGANLATNYYGVGHPSLTNYLETVGGSNFGVRDDFSPDWHNATCQTNLATGLPNLESSKNNICPIAGAGMDAATPKIDTTNETTGLPGDIDLDGIHFYPAAHTVGKTIADQLTTAGKTWRSYQGALPLSGADGVNVSDGSWSNLTTFTTAEQALGLTQANIVAKYAAKHDPFVYFANVQATAVNGQIPGVVPFDGAGGLYADLAAGNVPNYAFIAPDQCSDMHGRGNGGPFCQYDPNDNGTLTGLNPALIAQGDMEVQKIVTAIKASPAWVGRPGHFRGRSAIVIVWDENDYSVSPTTNRVALIVDKNYGVKSEQSARYYTHFSLLRSVEAGFGLPCLNHACDAGTFTMVDMFH